MNTETNRAMSIAYFHRVIIFRTQANDDDFCMKFDVRTVLRMFDTLLAIFSSNSDNSNQCPLLPTRFNFNPSIDK